MKTFALTVLCALIPAALAAQHITPQPISSLADAKAPVVHALPTRPMQAPAPTRSGSLSADFGIMGENLGQTVWSENFDSGQIPESWQISENTQYVEWSVKATSGDKAFSAIDPDDSFSLFVEGPYQIYRRENSSIITSKIDVPENATLEGWLGCSRNLDDCCRIYIAATTDDENFTDLWNSSQLDGELPWAWRHIQIDLSQYAGQTIKLRIMYGWGSGDEIFKAGGYLGDFYIDGLKVVTPGASAGADIITGDILPLRDLSTGQPDAWLWSMPGAVPETSTLQNPEIYYTNDGVYDITLTVSRGDEKASVTKTAFVRVTGTEPVARIGYPASFRHSDSRLPWAAPFSPVTFTDASLGFPDSWQWSIAGVNPSADILFTSTDEAPEVRYSYLHTQNVSLQVANSHGSSSAEGAVAVEYTGLATNLLPGEYVTNFDMEDRGIFPGSNKLGITAYAEKFSKPSRPAVITGVYVYFTRAQAEQLIDQLQNVGVHICRSENGIPGQKIDSWWWSVYELDASSSGDLVATYFPFTEKVVVDDEFFVMIDGIPECSDDCSVAFAMADWRAEGGTAYMLKNDRWIPVSTYFPAGANHTSYAVFPEIIHSAIGLLPQGTETLEIGASGGLITTEVFSIMGLKFPAQTSADWCRVLTTQEPELTVSTIGIQVDPMTGATDRQATVTLTDGVAPYTFTVRQLASSGLQTLETDAWVKKEGAMLTLTSGAPIIICTPSGVKVAHLPEGTHSLDTSGWPHGVYYLVTPAHRTHKILL